MFSATTQSLPLSEACIQSLCASLNAPVVRVDALPAGPARAAVVVYAEQYGDLGMAVAVRSLEGGEVALMRAQEPLPPDADPAEALELAISFAEGLGFVFDEDMVGADAPLAARHAALDHWQHLVGSDEAFEPPDVASPPAPLGADPVPDPERLPHMEDLLSGAADDDGEPVEIELDELSLGDVGPDDLDTDGSELMLDEIAPLEVDTGQMDDGAARLADAGRQPRSDAAPEAAEGARAQRRAVPEAEITEPSQLDEAPMIVGESAPADAAFAASPLSKFRRPEDEPTTESKGGSEDEADEPPGGGSALGKIQIVRMRKSRDGRAPARARVLGSY